MSGIWKDMKKVFTTDEMTKAITDIENKKKTITQASQNEQNALISKISETYRTIGETAYRSHMDGSFELENISPMFETIKGLYQSLKEKQAKLDEILARYDDELKILRPTEQTGQAACGGCGTAYVPGEMLFCSKCGNKLPTESVDVGAAAPAPTQMPKCSNCNAENVAEAVFCAGCGSKL